VKFRVRYQSGEEVDMTLAPGAHIGRDKSCDYVLKDPQCSRRHAALDPDGVTFRDSGSANGIFVNGRKVDQAVLKFGDLITLGSTHLTVLPEEEDSGTIAIGALSVGQTAPAPPAPPAPVPTPDGTIAVQTLRQPPVPEAQPAPAPPAPPAAAPPAPKPEPAPEAAKAPAPPPPQAAPSAPPVVAAPSPKPEAPAPRPPAAEAAEPRPRTARRPPRGVVPRPVTVTLLAGLWAVTAPILVVLGVYALWKHTLFLVLVCLGAALVAAAMAVGLFARTTWARPLQLALAGVGLFTPFLVPAGAVLMYMLRPDVGISLSGRDYSDLTPDEEALLDANMDGTFASAIVMSLAGTLVVLAFVWFLARR
jgi:hypothetical protein